MRPLMTRSDSLYASPDAPCAPLETARERRGLRGLPFGLGAVTLAVLGAGLCVAPAHAQDAAAGGAEAAPSAVDVANGPIVAILSPHYNDQLKGAAQVLVAVQGRKNTPRGIQMFVDGRSDSKGPMDLQSFPSSNFSWDTTRFSDGLHRLSVVVTDTQGFRGSADVNVYINNNKVVDATPPSLQWLNVRPRDGWSGLVDLQVKAVDNFGVKFLIVSINPAATPDRKPAAFSWFLNRPPYAINFDSRKAPDGLYSLRATAYDALENEGAAPEVTVSINNHSINPTFAIPPIVGGLKPLASGRILPELSPVGPTGASAGTSGVIELEPAAPARSAAVPPTAASTTVAGVGGSGGRTPSKVVSRVAGVPARGIGKPSLSTASSMGDASVTAVPSSSPRTWASEHVLSGRDRMAVDVTPRPLKQASSQAAMSRPDMMPRDGLALSPAPTSRAAGGSLGQRASAPIAPERTESVATGTAAIASPASRGAAKMGVARVASSQALGSENRTPGAPSLSMAPSAGGSGASVGVVTGAAGSSRGALQPLSPSGPPRVADRVAAAPSFPSVERPAPRRPLVSNGQGTKGVTQGSPVAPTFPGVDLKRPVPQSDPRSSTPPVVAMAPPADVLSRVSGSAITVAPALSSTLPTLHRALKGETLASVAGRYSLPVAVLALHNHLPEDAVLKAGQEVRMPQALAVSMAGELVQGDVSSMMIDSVGVTPFRFLFEKQGGKLMWDAANKRVTAQNATHQVTLTIGSKSALVNEKEEMMDLAAFLVSGRTMVPLRFFEKALDASVEWEPATGRLLVAMAQ